ncbi:MAG TPA: hypothetical protein VK427_19720 [Kofleriaceae bacterium]|nr:hypothetical protein [Kofleriaceae bacterium]
MWWRRLRYVLLLIALCAIATCPSAKRSCQAKNRADEADELLGYLAARVSAYVAAHGHVPPTPAGPTPLPDCCEQGGVCAEDVSRWQTPGWQALQFTIDGEHRFTYSYVPDASGRAAVLRAIGDLDCDDVTSLYEVEIKIDATGLRRKWTRKNPYE